LKAIDAQNFIAVAFGKPVEARFGLHDLRANVLLRCRAGLRTFDLRKP
jgi:hypothetical protein